MLIIHNPDEWETVSEYYICPYHKKHPGTNYAGCTCSGSLGLKRKATFKDEFSEWDKLSDEALNV